MTENTTTIVSESNLTVDDISKGETTQTIVYQEPPRYGFINPAALHQTNNYGPSTIPSNNPGQWTAMGNIRYPSNISSVNPLAMNPQLNDIETYKVWSIFNILCCCLCLGFVACYYSSETEEAKRRGDIQVALNASKNARTFNIITTIVGIIILTVYGLYYGRVFS